MYGAIIYESIKLPSQPKLLSSPKTNEYKHEESKLVFISHWKVREWSGKQSDIDSPKLKMQKQDVEHFAVFGEALW